MHLLIFNHISLKYGCKLLYHWTFPNHSIYILLFIFLHLLLLVSMGIAFFNSLLKTQHSLQQFLHIKNSCRVFTKLDWIGFLRGQYCTLAENLGSVVTFPGFRACVTKDCHLSSQCLSFPSVT